MRPSFSPHGYLSTSLTDDNGKSSTVLYHKIVALTWIENKDNKPEINHINGIKYDNRVENLEWVSRQENISHAWANGLYEARYGEETSNAKLTEDQVKEIKLYLKTAPKLYGRKKLAKKYGVSESAIKNIVAEKTWKHIKVD